MIDIKSLFPEELEEYITSIGFPKYRASQLFSWFTKGISSLDECSNLPANFKEKLLEEASISGLNKLRKQVSQEDGTIKYLWELSDGNAVETVVMQYHYGNTICISTQVGCRQGCAFCASTIGGLVRNLTASEMLDEVLFSEKDSGLPISHIVLMGIGEPLDNFDNVIRFLKLINHPKGRNISLRNVSLSTCGLIEKFDSLASLNLPITLSVSLHAPDDETRSKIMPANINRGVDALFEACKRYFNATGRRISFEYALIQGVTDSLEQAQLLAKRVKPLAAHVNLIPLNHVDERNLSASPASQVKAFQKELERLGVNATIRRKLGNDVDASCGQLRRKTMENKA